jgi:hypothetical protein
MNALNVANMFSAVHLLGVLFATSRAVVNTACNIILSLENSFLRDGMGSDNYSSEENV